MTSCSQTKKRISAALIDCATLRSGTVQKDALNLYATRLSKEPLQDVIEALEKLGEFQRKDYEPAIPDIGALLSLVFTCTISRRNRLEASRNTRMVRWRCPACGVYICGWVAPSESLERRCKGLPVSGRTDRNNYGVPICGAEMVVQYDAQEESDDRRSLGGEE